MPADARPDGPRPRRRDYEKALARLEAKWRRKAIDRGRLLHDIVDALWDVFGGGVYSWCGFYFPDARGKELTLGPHRDKPACSPIGFHGVCGRAASSKTTQIVPDVKALGAAHIECDPENRSEIAIPVFDEKGEVFAVLDVDSRQVGAFDDEDRRWLEKIVKKLAPAA